MHDETHGTEPLLRLSKMVDIKLTVEHAPRYVELDVYGDVTPAENALRGIRIRVADLPIRQLYVQLQGYTGLPGSSPQFTVAAEMWLSDRDPPHEKRSIEFTKEYPWPRGVAPSALRPAVLAAIRDLLVDKQAIDPHAPMRVTIVQTAGVAAALTNAE